MKDAPSRPLQPNEKCYAGTCGHRMGPESHRQMIWYSDKQVKDFSSRQQMMTQVQSRENLLWKRKAIELQRKITFLEFSSCSRKLFELVKCANQKGLPFSITAQLCAWLHKIFMEKTPTSFSLHSLQSLSPMTSICIGITPPITHFCTGLKSSHILILLGSVN